MHRLKLSTLRSGQEVNSAKLYKKAAFSVYSAVSSARECDGKTLVIAISHSDMIVLGVFRENTLYNWRINDSSILVITV